MDNDATTWQACKLCIKTATSELISAMSISSESKNRVKSTAAAPMSARMAKVRTLVEVQPSIQSVAHCAASVPFMAAILFSVSAYCVQVKDEASQRLAQRAKAMLSCCQCLASRKFAAGNRVRKPSRIRGTVPNLLAHGILPQHGLLHQSFDCSLRFPWV